MTTRPRTIIVGVDFSDASITALDEALAVARLSEGARVVPVLALAGGRATRPMSLAQNTDALLRSTAETLRKLTNERHAKMKPGAAEPQIVPRVEFGDPAAVLVQLAGEELASLVVVGTHGRDGLEHTLLGSVAETVSRRAPCSVLVARVARRPSTEPTRSEREAEAEPAGGDSEGVSLLTEPHLDGGRLVLRVLDERSGEAMLCAFESPTKVSVEALGRRWVTRPSSEQRARAAAAALAHAAEEPSLYRQLFAELARREAENKE